MRLRTCLAALAASPAAALWPIPVDISTGNQTLFIDQTINITYNGESVTTHPRRMTSCLNTLLTAHFTDFILAWV